MCQEPKFKANHTTAVVSARLRSGGLTAHLCALHDWRQVDLAVCPVACSAASVLCVFVTGD